MGDLLRAAQSSLLVDPGRPTPLERKPDVAGETAALLFEQDPREPFDQTVRDDELARALGDEAAFLELPFQTALLAGADPGLRLGLGASLGLPALLLEAPPLGLGLATLRLGLAFERALLGSKRAGDVLGKFVALRGR